MTPARIAAWFVARSPSIGGGRGGIPSLTWADVAAACAGRNIELGWHLIQARYAHSIQSAAVAVRLTERMLTEELKARGRKMGRLRQRQLAGICVEAFCTRVFCTDCNGEGILRLADKKRVECPACGGRGDKEMRNAEKARRMGIKQQSWDWYAPLADSLMVRLEIAEQETAREVTRKLNSEEWER